MGIRSSSSMALASEAFLSVDAGRKRALFERNPVIGERACRRIPVAVRPLNFDSLEEFVGGRISDGGFMLESKKLSSRHFASRRGVVMFEHVLESVPEQLQVAFRELRPFRELCGYEAMRAI